VAFGIQLGRGERRATRFAATKPAPAGSPRTVPQRTKHTTAPDRDDQGKRQAVLSHNEQQETRGLTIVDVCDGTARTNISRHANRHETP
jgi:hypothetical protein